MAAYAARWEGAVPPAVSLSNGPRRDCVEQPAHDMWRGLEVDVRQMTDEDYTKMWHELGPIEIKMVEKTGKCPHNQGDTFIYPSPNNRPDGVCHALLHVLEHYVWRVGLDFPSWEDDDRDAHRFHCPSKTGTVWEVRKVRKHSKDEG